MKNLLYLFLLLISVTAFSSEKVIFKLYQFEENDTLVESITIVSDDYRSAIVQGVGRMVFDYKKDTLFIIDDSAKTVTRMSVALVGLLFSGLSGLSSEFDSSEITIRQNEKMYDYLGKKYPQFSVFSDEDKILTVAYDNELDYPYTKKSIERLKNVVETFLGFDMQNEAVKSIIGLPKVMLYYKNGEEKTKTLLVSDEKGSFEKLFSIPDSYKSGD
ncbi:MAG: hypothetical protein AB7T10_06080 [bacterium]